MVASNVWSRGSPNSGWTMDEAMQELPRFGFHRIWKHLKRYLKKLDMKDLRRQVEKAKAPKVDRGE